MEARCGVEAIVEVILETAERKVASRDWNIHILMVTEVYTGSTYTDRYSHLPTPHYKHLQRPREDIHKAFLLSRNYTARSAGPCL